MLQRHEPCGPYISISAAAYPEQMNVVLADLWVRGRAATELRASQITYMVRTGRLSICLVATHLMKLMPAPMVGGHVQRADVVHTQPTNAWAAGMPVH